jgi:hypothetical protein
MLDMAILGTPRKHPDKCSKCDAEIPDEAVPLMLFADGRNLMWCYCERCEESMFLQLYKPKREAPAHKQTSRGAVDAANTNMLDGHDPTLTTTGVETHGEENQSG